MTESLPLEIQWIKIAAEVIQTVGMPGVIAGLLYLLKMQRDANAAQVGELQAAVKDEQSYNRKLQEDRITAATASADRMATVAVSPACWRCARTSRTRSRRWRVTTSAS